jgi:polyribonucleotide nucleotidyltransferase
MIHEVTAQFAGRPIKIQTGRMAKQADASVVVTYGETVVLVAVTVTDDPITANFLPLRVDFEEKMYSVGRIPGGFFKREGKPSDDAVLVSRLIDRPIRPLLPSGLRNDVQVVATPLSVDPAHAVDVVAMIGASAAMHLSSIPFAGPFAAVRVGRIEGEFVVNPSYEQLATSDMNLIIAATSKGVMQMELEADQVLEDAAEAAIRLAEESCQPVVQAIEELREKAGKPKRDMPLWAPKPEIVALVEGPYKERIHAAVEIVDKIERYQAMRQLQADVLAEAGEGFAGCTADVDQAVEKVIKKRIIHIVLDEHRRVDGRAMDEVRPIECDAGLLPRVHGSGLFQRGETQVLTLATLGAVRDQQLVRTLEDEEYRHFMHHYNFPPFCVGEVRAMRSPGRREIGHGALVAKSLKAVLPPDEEFPYTIRLVSEVLESNGSSSMASVCASTLSLMDAGVPIKAPVAGISVGLIYESEDRFACLTDIQGLEDFCGHMDFKVAGTRTGINAIHLDMKVQGLPTSVLRCALDQARQARLSILDLIVETLPYPRTELSPHAPRMVALSIDREKIGLVIGPGGKNIRGLQDQFEVQIDVEDDGTVLIFGVDAALVEGARKQISDMTRGVEIGEVFEGRVTSTTGFGAFVELMPGREGLVHISHLAWEHIDKTEDVCKIGDMMQVKVIDVDDEGKIRLSRKELLPRPPGGGGGERSGGGGGDRGRGGPSRGGGGGRPPRAGGGDGEPGSGSYFREKKR